MPSVHINKEKSPYWFASFTNADNRRSFKSTKQTDKTEAMRICLEYADAAKSGREGRLSEGQVRKVMADIFTRANREALPAGTVKECLTSWLSTKSLEVEESSLVQYQLTVKQFLDFLGPKADRPIDTITLKDITGFKDSLARRLSAATTNKTLKIIGIAWRQARRDGLITDNIFERVKGVKEREGNRRPFTAGELRAILAVADAEWRGMILLGYYTGMRLVDIARLTWANIDLATAEIHFTAQKTNKPMQLPLAPPVVNYLMHIPSSDDPTAPLFQTSYDAAQKTTGTISNRFYGIMFAAGLVPKRTHEKQEKKDGRAGKRASNELSFHCLRHNAASDLRSNGVSNSIAMAILGHESEAIARNYTKIDRKALRHAVNALPDITKDLPLMLV